MPFQKYVSWHHVNAWFPQTPGENHHCLLAYLSSQLPNGSLVADLGTQSGASALAFAYNPKVQVYTYDIANHIPDGVTSFTSVPSIHRVMGSCFDHIDSYIDAKIILLDISPHNGSDERHMVSMLLQREYKGLLVCDDIYAFPSMKSFWDEVRLKKYDVTSYGHWSGTGIISFDPKTIDIRVG